MIKITSPENVTEVELENGKKGKVLGFNLDFSLDSAFEIDLRAFAVTTQQTPFVCRGVTINNTDNTNACSMVYDNSLQFPHIAIAGQISTLQVPFIKNIPSIVFNSTKVAVSTIINVYLFDFPTAPASFGNVGSNVNVINTISANISGPDPLPVSLPAGPLAVNRGNVGTKTTPFSGIVVAGSTQILAADVNVFRVKLWISGDSSMAAAGENLIQVEDGAVAIGEAKPWFPAAAGTVLGGVEILDLEISGGYAMANGSLNINLGTALASGNVYGYVEHN